MVVVAIRITYTYQKLTRNREADKMGIIVIIITNGVKGN